MLNKKVGVFLLMLLISLPFFGKAGEIVSLSISSDGYYVFSIDNDGHGVLWNLQNKSSKTIAKNANIYSAYWIKSTNNFMWQDELNNQVTIQNINGQVIKSFNPGVQTYGNIITSDLTYYFAADEDWSLYRINTITNKKTIAKATASDLKPYTFSIDNEGKYLVGTGDVVIWVWDIANQKLLRTFSKDAGKTFAVLSPNGQYVIAGDEGSGGHVWKTKTGEKFIDWLVDLNNGVCQESGKNDNFKCDKKGLIQKPKDFLTQDGHNNIDAILSLKFIDQTHYLRFTTYIPYAILYEVTNPYPLAYFPLGKHPYPAVNYYARDQAIDTSWQAHVLVVGKEDSDGILVYQYDPEKQTLTKVWDGSSCWMFC